MWRIMIETLETGITSPALPTLAEMERRTEELLAQPPTAALPNPEPRPRPNEPQHTLRSVFDEYALYGLVGEAVRHRLQGPRAGGRGDRRTKKILQEET